MAAKKKKKASKPVGKGGPSPTAGDFHLLLSERQTAILNGDKAAEKAVDKRLADLGYRP